MSDKITSITELKKRVGRFQPHFENKNYIDGFNCMKTLILDDLDEFEASMREELTHTYHDEIRAMLRRVLGKR